MKNPIIALLQALILLVSLAFFGCNGDTPKLSFPPPVDITSFNENSIVANAAFDCSQTTLARGNFWEVTFGSMTGDSITLNKNCFFESFLCGQVGYVNSDVSADKDIMEVILTNYIAQPISTHCMPLGRARCTYQILDAQFRELKLSCQPF